MILPHIKGGRLIKMEDRFNCKNCLFNISEKELFENDFFCPNCGKKIGWFSDPVLIGPDGKKVKIKKEKF